MTNAMKFAVALALVLFAVTIATAGIEYKFPADAAALPFSAKPGNETPVRATKGGRLHVRPEIPNFAGV